MQSKFRFFRIPGAPLVIMALTLALLTVAAMAGSAPISVSRDAIGRNVNPTVLPPGSMPYGRSYAEWGAEWWKWAISIPLPSNPMNDQTGANFTEGQSGQVWYLAGTFCPDLGACDLATATKTCAVPAGKALFFPVLNAECSTFEGNGTTEADLRACAQGAIDLAVGLQCEIDGVPVGNLGDYRATSGLFTWGPLPGDNIFGASAGITSPAVSDGYWIMLAPLPAGQHTIHFAGAFAEFFALDVTYHLTVVPGGRTTPVLSMEGEKATTTSWGRLKTLYR
jgi:hypothetical protein